MLSGTEAEIINSVARSKKATKSQLKRELGLSSGYTGVLCRYLVRKNYLIFSEGQYSLTRTGIETLLKEETSKIDRKLLREIAGEVAREISGDIKEAVRGIRGPGFIKKAGREAKEEAEEKVRIKTDFEFPVEDESLVVESNIGEIGAKIEKERSNIDKSVKLFRKMQKREKR